MDSFGYTLSEILELPDAILELREEENRKKKLTHLGLAFLAIITVSALLTLEIIVTVDSYLNPSWQAAEIIYDNLPFPAIMMCPRQMVEFKSSIHIKSCCVYDSYANQSNTDYDIDYSVEEITNTYSFLPIKIHEKNGTKSFNTLSIDCVVLNYNLSNVLYSQAAGESLVVGLTVDLSQINTTISLALFDQNDPIPTINSQSIQTLINPGSVGYLMISRSDQCYLNGTVQSSFSSTVTTVSINSLSTKLVLDVTYMNMNVVTYQQYVAYNWLWLLGVIAGILAFGRSIYTIFIKVVDYIFFKEEKKKKTRIQANQ